ncbi:hypothetical protein CMV_027591 [Castanea mollissima]|uniref:Uncharacterized protein n=1 Tax=Castanea mollissima TaxID=60419 RepID=A0A8J4V981_9ROSI|nr:hypothetical protein CMV_027591 [Castanea mollissima]
MLSQGKCNLQRCADGLVGDQWGVVPGFQLQGATELGPFEPNSLKTQTKPNHSRSPLSSSLTSRPSAAAPPPPSPAPKSEAAAKRTKELAQALREKKQPLVILELVLLQHVNLNYYSAVAVAVAVAVVGRRGIRVKERRQP